MMDFGEALKSVSCAYCQNWIVEGEACWIYKDEKYCSAECVANQVGAVCGKHGESEDTYL